MKTVFYLILCLSFQVFSMEKKISLEEVYNRQYFAATYLKNLSIPIVIEIGGGQDCLSSYLKNKKIIVIDPVLRPSKVEGTEFIGQSFEDVRLDLDKNYGVAILGLQLHFTNENSWLKLYDLINGAQRTIIEYAADFTAAKKQIKNIHKNCKVNCVKELPFLFCENKRRDQKKQVRVLCILEKSKDCNEN